MIPSYHSNSLMNHRNHTNNGCDGSSSFIVENVQTSRLFSSSSLYYNNELSDMLNMIQPSTTTSTTYTTTTTPTTTLRHDNYNNNYHYDHQHQHPHSSSTASSSLRDLKLIIPTITTKVLPPGIGGVEKNIINNNSTKKGEENDEFVATFLNPSTYENNKSPCSACDVDDVGDHVGDVSDEDGNIKEEEYENEMLYLGTKEKSTFCSSLLEKQQLQQKQEQNQQEEEQQQQQKQKQDGHRFQVLSEQEMNTFGMNFMNSLHSSSSSTANLEKQQQKVVQNKKESQQLYHSTRKTVRFCEVPKQATLKTTNIFNSTRFSSYDNNDNDTNTIYDQSMYPMYDLTPELIEKCWYNTSETERMKRDRYQLIQSIRMEKKKYIKQQQQKKQQQKETKNIQQNQKQQTKHFDDFNENHENDSNDTKNHHPTSDLNQQHHHHHHHQDDDFIKQIQNTICLRGLEYHLFTKDKIQHNQRKRNVIQIVLQAQNDTKQQQQTYPFNIFGKMNPYLYSDLSPEEYIRSCSIEVTKESNCLAHQIALQDEMDINKYHKKEMIHHNEQHEQQHLPVRVKVSSSANSTKLIGGCDRTKKLQQQQQPMIMSTLPNMTPPTTTIVSSTSTSSASASLSSSVGSSTNMTHSYRQRPMGPLRLTNANVTVAVLSSSSSSSSVATSTSPSSVSKVGNSDHRRSQKKTNHQNQQQQQQQEQQIKDSLRLLEF